MLLKTETMGMVKEQYDSNQNKSDIFDRMRAGELFRLDDPEYPKVLKVVSRTIRLSAQLNLSTDVDQIRYRLSKIIGTQLHKSTTIFTPFHTNFGRFIQIG